MTRMTGPDCVVMCNLMNTYTRTRAHTHSIGLEAELSLPQLEVRKNITVIHCIIVYIDSKLLLYINSPNGNGGGRQNRNTLQYSIDAKVLLLIG